MNWIDRGICGLLIVTGLLGTAGAGEYSGATIARGYMERLAFHHEGKAQVLPFGIGLKFYDIDGQELSLLDGAGILTRGNKVTIGTAEDETSKKEQVVSIRLLEGTIAQPAPETGVDLNPDPNFKEEVQSTTLPDEWVAYFPTAKVGDYAQWAGFGRYRLEVLAADGDDLTVARVVDTRGTRHEFRTRYTISKAQKDRLKQQPKSSNAPSSSRKTATATKAKSAKPAKKLTAAQKKALKEKEAREAEQAAAKAKKEEPKTQPMLVDGRQLVCDVQKISSEHTRWYSPEVPFTGFVMVQRPNENEQLVAFGRGK